MKYTIVSPVHNEEAYINELYNRVEKEMNKITQPKDWEYILINDASTDRTKLLLDRLAKNKPNAVVLAHSKRRGQTGCFGSAFSAAKGKYCITLDADLQVMPEDIHLFTSKLEAGYDVVNGLRENRQHPFWIRLASRFYNLLMLLFFDSPVFDAASNFTGLRTSLVKNVKLEDNDHRYLISIVQRRGAKRIGEVVIRHNIRLSGKSKYKALPKYLKGLPEIFFSWLRIKSGKYDL